MQDTSHVMAILTSQEPLPPECRAAISRAPNAKRVSIVCEGTEHHPLDVDRLVPLTPASVDGPAGAVRPSEAEKQTLCQLLEGPLAQSCLDGVHSCAVFIGPDGHKERWIQGPHGVLSFLAEQRLLLTARMTTMGTELSGTITCAEIHGEKVRDVLATNASSHFTERKLRSTRPFIDGGLCEQPIQKTSIDAIQNHTVLDADSSLIVTLTYRVKDCGVTRMSSITLAAIGSSAANATGGNERNLKTSATAVDAVIEALTENATNKKRKAYVPFRTGVASQMLADALGSGHSKIVLVGCIASSRVGADIDHTVRMLSKARAITTVLAQNEEFASVADIKSEMAALRHKLELSEVPPADFQRQMKHYADMQASLLDQRASLEQVTQQKSEAYVQLKAERDARELELLTVQSLLQDKKLAAIDAAKAKAEIEELERLQAETDDKLAAEERLRWQCEADLMDARQLEEEISELKAAQTEREQLARQEREVVQARAVASVLRTAYSLTKDRLSLRGLEVEVARLQKVDGELQHIVDVVSGEVRTANRRRNAAQKMFSVCEDNELKLKAQLESIVQNVDRHLSLIRGETDRLLECGASTRCEAEQVEAQIQAYLDSVTHEAEMDVLREQLDETQRRIAAEIDNVEPDILVNPAGTAADGHPALSSEQRDVDRLEALITGERSKQQRLRAALDTSDAGTAEQRACVEAEAELHSRELRLEGVQQQLRLREAELLRLQRSHEDLKRYFSHRVDPAAEIPDLPAVGAMSPAKQPLDGSSLTTAKRSTGSVKRLTEAVERRFGAQSASSPKRLVRL